MGSYNKMTDKELHKAIEMIESGYTYQEIANKLKRHKDTVRKKLNRLGYKKPKKWTNEEVETAKSLYESGMNFAQVGRELGKNGSSVYIKLKALGIKSNNKMLYDIESVRGHIIDVDEAKQTTYQSNKKILFKCSTDGCDNTKMMKVNNLVNRGYSCPNCSSNISYPELFFTAYLEVKNIPYETQVIFEDLSDRKYDFRIILNGVTFLCETHGGQHYLTKDKGYYNVETVQESDKIKRQYAKNNNINYIELDCRESNFEFIRNSIENNKFLPSLEDKEIPNMLELMELNSKYPVKKIIKMYESGKSTVQLGKELGYDATTVGHILKRNNIKLRDGGNPKRMVRLVETNQIFSSGHEAMRETGIANSNISHVCNGKLKTAGGYHWEYVDNE